MKSIGEKTVNLFDKKKKEVEDLAAAKAHEAQGYAEEQAHKIGDAVEQTKNEAGELISGTGLCSCSFVLVCGLQADSIAFD